MDSKIKVAWLAPYPISSLKSIVFARPIRTHGTTTWLANLAKELVKNDSIELHVITETGNIASSQEFSEGGIHFHIIRNTIPFTGRGFPYYLPLQELTLFLLNSLRIKKALYKINPDILHAHGTENSYALTSIRTNYPSVISMQGIMTEIIKMDPNFRFKIKAMLERYSIRRGKYFLCRTNLDSSFVRSMNRNAQIFTVHEVMNPAFFKNDWKVSSQNSLLFVGSVQERKGIKLLLEALIKVRKVFPDVFLYIIGRGEAKYLKSLNEFCHLNEIHANVQFLGYQVSEKIAEYHVKSQILICPSLVENSPNCVAEAMVSGLPVIATDTGGIPSMIAEDQTGYLFERNNALMLADKIINLLSDPEKRNRISRSAIGPARSLHHPENVARATMAVYRTVIEENKSGD